METQTRRTWAEVSRGNLRQNYKNLRQTLASGCRLMGMVKSNAYGHGAVFVAKELETLGAEYLGVACLEEGAELREAGIRLPILVLGASPLEELPELLHYGLTQSIHDRPSAEAFSKAALALGKTLPVHIKVDTGMSRLGFFCDEQTEAQASADIQAIYPLLGLQMEGIFTHFAVSDEDEAYTRLQFDRFLRLLARLEKQGCHFAIRHSANSAATLQYPQMHLDMVRPGLALYGQYPMPRQDKFCALAPVMELRSRIATIRNIPKGTSVSYGRMHTLTRDSRLAVIPIGYGDGFFRRCSNVCFMGIAGKRVPILGKICMDMCMVDVTDLPEATAESEVVIYSRDPQMGATLDEYAQALGTISYELLCALANRVPRFYID